MRQKWITALGFAVAFSLVGSSMAAAGASTHAQGAVGIAPLGEVSPLDETCVSGHACVWTEKFFQGAKGESLCTGGVHTLAGFKKSGKNRCANKAVILRQSGTRVGCMEPGENAASLSLNRMNFLLVRKAHAADSNFGGRPVALCIGRHGDYAGDEHAV